MKAINGGKSKNDKIDSQNIAATLCGGMLPMAYTYPQKMSSTLNLLHPAECSVAAIPEVPCVLMDMHYGPDLPADSL